MARAYFPQSEVQERDTLNIRNLIIEAIDRADDSVRQYGPPRAPMSEVYADAILERVSEIASVQNPAAVLAENARYRRALEYIANAPVSTETEIVLQGRAIIGLLDKGEDDGEDA